MVRSRLPVAAEDAPGCDRLVVTAIVVVMADTDTDVTTGMDRRTLRNRPVDRLWNMCHGADPGGPAIFEAAQWAEIRRSRQLPKMIATLERAEANVRLLRKQLESIVAGEQPRLCLECGRPVYGRSDRKFCSTDCRVRNHRAHRGEH